MTNEPAKRAGYYWCVAHPAIEELRYLKAGETFGLRRSIDPVPTFAVCVAMHAVCDAARECRDYSESGGPRFMEWEEKHEALYNAVARLERALELQHRG